MLFLICYYYFLEIVKFGEFDLVFVISLVVIDVDRIF